MCNANWRTDEPGTIRKRKEKNHGVAIAKEVFIERAQKGLSK